MNSSITLSAVPLECTFPWMKLPNLSLSSVTNNPVKPAIYHLLELEMLRSKGIIMPGCNSRGWTRQTTFPSSHPAFPPPSGTSPQPAQTLRPTGALLALPGDLSLPAPPVLWHCSPLLQCPGEGGLCQPQGIGQEPQNCCSKWVSKLSVQLLSSTWGRFWCVCVWCLFARNAKHFLTCLA